MEFDAYQITEIPRVDRLETSALNVLHHTVESPLIQLQSSQQNMVNETEDGNCSREQTTDNVKNAHCNTVEKYLPKTFVNPIIPMV